ncbi:putative effector protein [Blumeria hordei DH14]|uniref:Putative effector protein n=1 Tax=Blumeria graminis f. sp. hordei (strain DH14) TaxID=546991 RepID=N1JJS6_BLUG1|nr:putative effector protein [Blumeria hordei DH14]
MNCLLAIFFFTGEDTPQNHRLALVSNSSIPVNEIYTLHHNTAFPEPRKGSDVYKTQVDVKEPGTYVTVYCSRNWQSDEIRQRLWDARDKLSNYERGDPITRSEVEANCQSLIRSMTSEPQAPVAHSKDLIESGKCTHKALSDLALECKFKSEGRHLSNGSKFNNYRPTVIFDSPIRMSSVTGDGKFMQMAVMGGLRRVMAWCNRNIHILQRSLNGDVWFLETSLIYTPENGEKITEFLLKTNPQIRKAWMQSTPSLGYIRNTRSSKLREDKGPLLILGTKLRGEKLLVDKLASIDATGSLGGEICDYLGDIYEQTYEDLYKIVYVE